MKFMARILIAILVVAMMFSVVGCGNTKQNGGNSNGANGATNEQENNDPGFYEEVDLQNRFEDIEYTPSEENLIGVAIYPIEAGTTKYTYDVGEMISINADGNWKTMLINSFFDSDADCTYNIWAGNAAEWENDDEGRYGEYQSLTEFLYIGYIYEIDGEKYILTTHDLVNFQDGVSVMSIKTIRTYTNGDPVVFRFIIRK